MVYIYVDGLDYKHDIFQLVSEISSHEEIKFIADRNEFYEFLDFKYKIYLESRDNYIYGEFFYLDSCFRMEEEINYKYTELLGSKSTYNNSCKRLIYKMLDKVDLISPEIEWGILTGIRPMKIIHRLIDSKISIDEIDLLLKNEYLLKNRVISQMLQIAQIQRPHIERVKSDEISLYVHIPFCPSKCSYCSFATFMVDNKNISVNDYIDILIYEIKETAKIFKNKKVTSLYIGGGTPTALKEKDLLLVIDSIISEFEINIFSLKEFTVEAGRPDTIDESYLKALKNAGVNRLSINPQTMNNKTLKTIGRNHDKKSIISAYNLAKQIEFDIINMDVILGLPGENLNDIKNTIREIIDLSPENITIHSLAMKNGSYLKEEEYEAKNEIAKEELISFINSYMTKSNMSPYYLYRQKQSFANSENIGYAKKDKESVYNILMMEEKETIIGLGLGSVSKFISPNSSKVVRVPNFKGMKDYLTRVDELLINKQQVVNKFY